MAAPPTAKPWRRAGAGLVLTLRVTPKSARDAIEGVELRAAQPVLKARVRAAPEKGKANAALASLVAKWLGVPAARVTLVGGAASRVKSLEIAGDPLALEEAIVARLGGGFAASARKGALT